MRFPTPLALCLLAPLLPDPARAELRLPDCEALAAFARQVDLKPARTVTPFKTWTWPEAFLGAEMVALYGKPASEFTAAESDQAEAAAKACGKTVAKDDRRAVGAIEKQFARSVGPVAAKREAALAALAAAIPAFEAIPGGSDKLRMVAAIRAVAEGDMRGVSPAAAGLTREARKQLDTVLVPLTELPTELAAAQAAPLLAAAEGPAQEAAVAEVAARYAAIEANERSLQRWDETVARIPRPAAGALTPEAETRLAAAAATRRAEIEDELIALALNRVEVLGQGPAAIPEIDRLAAGSLPRVLGAEAAARYRDALATRRRALALGGVATLPVAPETLLALPNVQAALTAPGGVASDDDRAAVAAAIDARRQEISGVVTTRFRSEIDAMLVDTEAFARIDQLTDPRLLAQLTPADAEALRASAATRRDAVGAGLQTQMAEHLAKLDDSERSLATIDTALLPGSQALPASAGQWRDGLIAQVAARRNAILAAITESERGTLEDRVYTSRDGALKVEFVDDDKAHVTVSGAPTLAVDYEELGETQVQIGMPQGDVVLTREGRWLVGGPWQLMRIQ